MVKPWDIGRKVAGCRLQSLFQALEQTFQSLERLSATLERLSATLVSFFGGETRDALCGCFPVVLG